MRHLIPILLSLLLSTSFVYSQDEILSAKELSIFNADSLAKHIKVLASDEFEGRKPFTRAEAKTINYLKEQFKRLHIEPGNGKSYFQDVPMVNIVTKASPVMRVSSASENFTLTGFDDYVIWTDKTDKNIVADKTEIVFAGYGVVAPEYNWNDYAGLDVRNKIVMVLVNDPGFNNGDSTLFKGKAMTYYGRWTYKFEEAARQGAKGCLIVHNDAGASYPFTVVQNSWNAARLHLDNRKVNVKYSDMIGWVTANAANKILKAAGYDSSLFARADLRGFKPVPLNVKLSASLEVAATYNQSHNVIAKITGFKRPEEYIIYSAHWDHLGIGKADETGDTIYNGAHDNASATAALLELARVFKNNEKPERTIVFLGVTAEEQGLWGSAYYAQNPVYPLAKTVANINMDGLNAFEKTKDIVVVGAGQSQLEEYLKDAALSRGRYIAFESRPEAGSYYRSDHFNFAKVGVPALYTSAGIDVEGQGPVYGKQKQDEYTQKHYHRPSDEYDKQTWTLAGGIEDLKLLYLVGKKLAFESTMPAWKHGSEFKLIREKSLERKASAPRPVF